MSMYCTLTKLSEWELCGANRKVFKRLMASSNPSRKHQEKLSAQNVSQMQQGGASQLHRELISLRAEQLFSQPEEEEQASKASQGGKNIW